MYFKNKLLVKTQLTKLKDHKYSCTNESVLDPFLQLYWNWLVTQIPLWVAPNLLTIVGLIINIVTSIILLSYSPDARAEAPSWTYACCAIGLFIYQSLDAIDGKQARRTNTSSPLGELFDHGCDSISTVFVSIAACAAVQLGNHPNWMFMQCGCAVTLFYCAHWQTYIQGTLKFGFFDVTEAQFSIMGIHMMSAVFGPTWWSSKLFGQYEVWRVMSICTFITAFTVLWRMVGVFRRGGVGRNGSTVAGTSIISPIIPFLLVVVPAYVISVKSKIHIYEVHPVLYVMTFGMLAAKVTNRLVVAHMTKSDMHYLDVGLIGPLLLFLNQYFNETIPEYCVLWVAFFWCTADLLMYSGQVCLEICDHLNIMLFIIKPKLEATKPALVRK